MSLLTQDRLVCVVGTSTAFAYWGFGVVAHAMEETVGAFHRVHCTSISEMDVQLRDRTHRSVLFTTDNLDEKLSTLLRNSDAPIVAVLDDVDVAIRTAAKLRRLSCYDAIRLSSRYIASLADVLGDARTSVFDASARSLRVVDFVPQLLSALGLTDSDVVRRVLVRIAPPAARMDLLTVDEAVRSTQEDVSDVAASWSSREQDVCGQIASEYQEILDRAPLKQMSWPAAIHYAATPGFQAEATIDLLGPARLLIWGPYMHLPKGRWTAAMEFEVVGNLSPNVVIADVLVGGEFAGLGVFDLPVRGIFAWSLAFEVTDAEKAIEVRLTLEKAAIEGVLLLRRARLRPLGDVAQTAPATSPSWAAAGVKAIRERLRSETANSSPAPSPRPGAAESR